MKVTCIARDPGSRGGLSPTFLLERCEATSPQLQTLPATTGRWYAHCHCLLEPLEADFAIGTARGAAGKQLSMELHWNALGGQAMDTECVPIRLSCSLSAFDLPGQAIANLGTEK